MNLNLFHHPENSVSNSFVSSFLKELQNYLFPSSLLTENTLYTLDRFEGKMAILENRSTSKLIQVSRSLLPQDIKEGDILKYKNGTYLLDLNQTTASKERIQNKMSNLYK